MMYGFIMIRIIVEILVTHLIVYTSYQIETKEGWIYKPVVFKIL